MAVSHRLTTAASFVVNFETGNVLQCYFCFSFQDCFGYSGSLEFLYEFWDELVSFCREVSWNFDGDCTESVDQFAFLIKEDH